MLVPKPFFEITLLFLADMMRSQWIVIDVINHLGTMKFQIELSPCSLKSNDVGSYKSGVSFVNIFVYNEIRLES